MLDQSTAELDVVPLLLLRPDHALGLKQRVEHLETCLSAILSHLALEVLLQQVEAADRVVLLGGRVFGPQPLEDPSRLDFFFNEAENLVHLVGYDIPVFVLLLSSADVLLVVPVGHVVSVFSFWLRFFCLLFSQLLIYTVLVQSFVLFLVQGD